MKAIRFVPFLAVMMCAYGPCSPPNCPTEATVDTDHSCWFEFTQQQPTVTVNAGELQVGFDKNSRMQSPSRYRFTFIQDPQEQVPRAQGRIGTWKLHIQTWKKQHPHMLKLAWTLRERRPSLEKQETLRLALSWLQHGKRHVKILASHYNRSNNRLHASLPTGPLQIPQTYLYPVRYKASKETKPYQSPLRVSEFSKIATARK